MPTPVSVLLRTSDEFITPSEVQSAAEVEMSSLPQHREATDGAYAHPQTNPPVPELVASSSTTTINTARAYQSAPQLSTDPLDYSYTSLLPAPLGMIPVPEEGSLENNPLQINDEFLLEDLPIDADDWAIGEGFDMDVDDGSKP